MDGRRDTLLFDLDGTLLDTLGDLHASVNHALVACGYPARSLDEVRRFVGNGVRRLMLRAVPEGTGDEAFDEVFQAFRTHYMAHCLDTTAPYDGIPTVLAELHRRGYRLGIVSNKLQPAVTELHRHFFADTVAVAIGESAGVRRKPAPDTLLVAMERLGATAADTVYVGESDVDSLTARAAGVPCLSVLWGFRSREELLRAGATGLVTVPEELSDMFP